jgi:3-methyladenine DNA glycosylase AlkD
MELLEDSFRANKDPSFASWQEAYMRHQFPFIGLRTALRRQLQKPYLKTIPFQKISALWEKEEREFQYAAMDIYLAHEMKEDHLPLLQRMITEKPWWDTVDLLAAKHCGLYFRAFPQQIPITREWIASNNLWLRRSALLFQLHYKKSTDRKLLFEYCLAAAKDKDPFIQRAIGWALREFGKSEPENVINFLSRFGKRFSSLSRREASVLLDGG